MADEVLRAPPPRALASEPQRPLLRGPYRTRAARLARAGPAPARIIITYPLDARPRRGGASACARAVAQDARAAAGAVQAPFESRR